MPSLLACNLTYSLLLRLKMFLEILHRPRVSSLFIIHLESKTLDFGRIVIPSPRLADLYDRLVLLE